MKIYVRFTDMSPDFDSNHNCYVRALRKNFDLEWSDDPDFVFYSAFGTEFLRYPKAVKIFLADEPVFPNFNDCDYAIGPMDIQVGGTFDKSDKSNKWNRYFRHPPFIGYGEENIESALQKRDGITDSLFERKFCNFIYSNAVHGKGAGLRIAFCKKLSRYRAVDCPGRVLNNMPDALQQRYVRGRVRKGRHSELGVEGLLADMNDSRHIVRKGRHLGFGVEGSLADVNDCGHKIRKGNYSGFGVENSLADVNDSGYEVRKGQTSASGWDSEKLRFLSEYKFTIAFENTALSGWVTEKLLHPFLAHSIPIYWGAPDVAELFNPKAFINCSDFANLDQAVQRVRELDRDKEQYLAMLREPPLAVSYPSGWEDQLAEYFGEIIRRGRKPFEKNPIGFSSMSAGGLPAACENGTAGMRAIAQMTIDCVKGWARYKLKSK